MIAARLAVVVGALVVALALVEVGVRIAERVVGDSGSAEFAPGSYQSEGRKSNNPVLGWELDPEGSEVNSEAFRDREYAREKTPGITRIVLLGDSIAFGHGVPVEQGVADQLEVSLGEGYEVLNFGVGGYNTRQTAESYATRARQFNADIVVLLYVLNDALPAARMAKLADIVEYRRNLPESSPLGLHFARHIRSFLERSRGLDAETTAPYVRETHTDPKTWRMVERGLERIGRLAREDGARALLVLTPLFFDLEDYAFDDIHAKVARAGRRSGFAVFDLVPALRGVDPFSLRLDPKDVSHPSPLGHRLIAEAIATRIRALPPR